MLNRVETIMPSMTAAAFVDMPYSPVVLLESSFDASITDDLEFHDACFYGYESYFEEMFEWNTSRTKLVFVERAYTWTEIVDCVVESVSHNDEPVFLSRSWRAGFGLGWLSALALTNRSEALRALIILIALLVPAEVRRTLVA